MPPFQYPRTVSNVHVVVPVNLNNPRELHLNTAGIITHELEAKKLKTKEANHHVCSDRAREVSCALRTNGIEENKGR